MVIRKRQTRARRSCEGTICEFDMAGPLPFLSMKVCRCGFLYLLGFARAEIDGKDKERFQVQRIMADTCQRSDIDARRTTDRFWHLSAIKLR
jgi:hypothetical protein